MPRPTYHKSVAATANASSRAPRLRHEASPPERLLWSRLRNRQLKGPRFRRQHPMGPYIAGFYCHEVSLVVEIDSRMHTGERIERDSARDEWMRERGVDVLRFDATGVLRTTVDVLRTIAQRAEDRLPKDHP